MRWVRKEGSKEVKNEVILGGLLLQILQSLKEKKEVKSFCLEELASEGPTLEKEFECEVTRIVKFDWDSAMGEWEVERSSSTEDEVSRMVVRVSTWAKLGHYLDRRTNLQKRTPPRSTVFSPYLSPTTYDHIVPHQSFDQPPSQLLLS